MELEQISTPHSRWIFDGNGDFQNSVSVKENGYGEILISISIKNGYGYGVSISTCIPSY
jgi:hypothetical protein